METTTTTEEQIQTQELQQGRKESQSTRMSHRTETQKPKVSTGKLMILLPIAIITDLMGGLDITGFGAIIVRMVDILVVLIFWLAGALKDSEGVKKNYTYQLFGTFLLEFSPFGIVPAWTTFVLYTYFADKKTGRKFLAKKSREQRIKNKNH
jgi:hypothetical protein